MSLLSHIRKPGEQPAVAQEAYRVEAVIANGKKALSRFPNGKSQLFNRLQLLGANLQPDFKYVPVKLCVCVCVCVYVCVRACV